MTNKGYSITKTTELRARFEECKRQFAGLGLISQGSIFESRPGTWRWTRKVKAKTVSVTLLQEQVEDLRHAIDQNREMEKLIDEMRLLSQQILLESCPPAASHPSAKKRPKPSLS